jgi:amidase
MRAHANLVHMRIDEYVALDAVAIAAAVRAGELSAVAVTEAAIGAIEALQPQLNALVLQDFTQAREVARGVSREAPLAGVPFLVKDVNLQVTEWPTTHSSRFFADAAPLPDSELVTRWRRAGTVFLGKTNTPEFADNFATEPVYRGTTLNPWNLAVTVGGSSGGAAAAVASGMVPVAHGTDVGGSIRVPAACCGLFGMKPSRGLNPLGPHHAELGAGLNCDHVLSRTVRDSAAFLDATAGPDPGAPYRVMRAVPSYLAALQGPREKLRVACISHTVDGLSVAPEIESRLMDAVRLVEGLGHEVVPARFPAEVAELATGEAWIPLWLMDIAMLIRDRTRQLGREPGPNEIETMPRYAVERIGRMSAHEYLDVRRLAHRICLAMLRAFGAFDLLMTPATGTLPPAVGALDANAPDFDLARWGAAGYTFAPFSELFNVTGQPAASLPLFQSASGLPIGIQLVGRQDEDHRLLCIAADLEAVTAWTNRHPPLWAGRPLA